MGVKVDTITDVTAMRTVSWKDTRSLVAEIKEWRRMAGLDFTRPPHHGDDSESWRAVFADVMPSSDGTL